MTSSVELKAVEARVAEYAATVRADDPRFRRCVLIVHEDSSVLYFRSAFVMRAAPWLVAVITEHHGNHVYHCEDLTSLSCLELGAGAIEDLP